MNSVKVPYSSSNTAAGSLPQKEIRIPASVLSDFRKHVLSNPGIYGESLVETFREHGNTGPKTRLMAAQWHFTMEMGKCGQTIEVLNAQLLEYKNDNAALAFAENSLNKMIDNFQITAAQLDSLPASGNAAANLTRELREDNFRLYWNNIFSYQLRPIRRLKNALRRCGNMPTQFTGKMHHFITSLKKVVASAPEKNLCLDGHALANANLPKWIAGSAGKMGPDALVSFYGSAKDASDALSNAAKSLSKAFSLVDEETILDAVRKEIAETRAALNGSKKFINRNIADVMHWLKDAVDDRYIGVAKDMSVQFFSQENQGNLERTISRHRDDVARLVTQISNINQKFISLISKLSSQLIKIDEARQMLASQAYATYRRETDELEQSINRANAELSDLKTLLAVIGEELRAAPSIVKSRAALAQGKASKRKSENCTSPANNAISRENKAAFLDYAHRLPIVKTFLTQHYDKASQLDNALLQLAEIYFREGGVLNMQSIKRLYPKKCSLQTTEINLSEGWHLARFGISDRNFYRLIINTGWAIGDNGKIQLNKMPAILFIGDKDESEKFMNLTSKQYEYETFKAITDGRLDLFPIVMRN